MQTYYLTIAEDGRIDVFTTPPDVDLFWGPCEANSPEEARQELIDFGSPDSLVGQYYRQ
jgi:hypothetical protein